MSSVNSHLPKSVTFAAYASSSLGVAASLFAVTLGAMLPIARPAPVPVNTLRGALSKSSSTASFPTSYRSAISFEHHKKKCLKQGHRRASDGSADVRRRTISFDNTAASTQTHSTSRPPMDRAVSSPAQAKTTPARPKVTIRIPGMVHMNVSVPHTPRSLSSTSPCIARPKAAFATLSTAVKQASVASSSSVRNTVRPRPKRRDTMPCETIVEGPDEDDQLTPTATRKRAASWDLTRSRTVSVVA